MALHHHQLGTLPTASERTFTPLADASRGAHALSVHENILNPGVAVPLHEHAVEEVIVCLQGEGECSLAGATWQPYGAGSVLVIPPRTPHRLRNIGASHLVQIAVLGGPEPATLWHEPAGSVA